MTLGPASWADDGGAALPDSGTGAGLAPAVEPGIRPASPVGEAGSSGTASATTAEKLTAPATAGATSASLPAESVAPEPASIPPLWAPDADLVRPTPTPYSESATAAPATEALVPDSNTAAILTVFNRINEYRAANGLAAVKYNATVAGMAQEWSNNIATREVIEHRASFSGPIRVR